MLCATVIFSSCSKDDAPKEITITGGNANQTVYADETQGDGGIQFTAKQAWTASVNENAAVRANATDWVHLLFNGEEKYNGDAGSFTMTIKVDANTTGITRSAKITITSGSDEITATVTQNGKTEEGKIPDPKPVGPGVPAAGSRLVSKVVIEDLESGTTWVGNLVYDGQNRLIQSTSTSDDNDSDNTTYVYSQNSVDITSESEGDWGTETFVSSLTLGSNGYVSSGVQEYESIYPGGQSNDTNNWSADYDANGYMVNSSWNDSEEYTLTWSGGNLTKRIDEDGSETAYQYGNVANNPLCNLDLNYFTGGMQDHIPFGASEIRLCGKSSTKMISQVDYIYPDIPAENESYTYAYQTDAQDFVTKITCSEVGGSDIEITTITYK